MKLVLQELTMGIWDMCKQFDIDLVMDWQPRKMEMVKFTDMLSKDWDFSDFYLSDMDFSVIQSRFGPFSCDYFVSSFTFRMRPFASRYLCEGAVGMDSFTLSWGEGRRFFHPPVHKILDVVRYAKEQEAEAILVVPYWPGTAFWAFLKAEERIDSGRSWWLPTTSRAVLSLGGPSLILWCST